MKKPPMRFISTNDPENLAKIICWLNSQEKGPWRIIEYSPQKSKLLLHGDCGDKQLYIMCLSTWYVRSQIYIPSPSFVSEVGKKKMSAGMLSGSCYDQSIKLSLNDGSYKHCIICDRIEVHEIPKLI